MHALRTRPSHNRRQGGLQAHSAKATGGYIDPGTVVDLAEIRRRRKAAIDADRKAKAERRQIRKREKAREITVSAVPLTDQHEALRLAWESAEPGTEKRKAIEKLRRFEKRHGMVGAAIRKRVEVEVVSAPGSLARVGS